ncbi:MAG: type II toxin-antitoxin system HicA family toxin [Lacisediminihabitans sp.]
MLAVKEVKQREVENALNACGWRLLRTKGGHNVWGAPDGKSSIAIAIPAHGEVSPGVVRQVVKALPETPDSWRWERVMHARKNAVIFVNGKGGDSRPRDAAPYSAAHIKGGVAAPREFEATATREGKWWIITVPELDAATQARNVREIDDMATGLVIALLDLGEDDVKVNVTVELPAGVAAAWREAEALQTQADADEQRAAALRRAAVKELLSVGRLSQAEAGAVLGLSYQRVQQLAK